MSFTRICVCLILSIIVSAPAFAKNETLAERGKRMCEEAGIPLEDCTILPPALRGAETNVAAATPAPRPLGFDNPVPAAFGTGKYGWCDDCTSLMGAAPVTPWKDFGGRSFQSRSDNDNRQRASLDNTSPGGSPGDDDSGGGDDGDDGNDGGDGDDGNDGGDGDDGNDGGDGDDGNDGGDGDDGGDGGDGDDGGDDGNDGGDGDDGNGGGEVCD